MKIFLCVITVEELDKALYLSFVILLSIVFLSMGFSSDQIAQGSRLLILSMI